LNTREFLGGLDAVLEKECIRILNYESRNA
jgi:hypothetical protein